MKYLAYGRKSTQDDSHQAQSIETQERILKDYVKQNNLEVVEYIYESRSAKDDGNRPQFNQMLKRFEKGEADGLLVCHIDRISRNWIEAGSVSKLFDLGIIKEIRTPSKIYNSVTDLFMMGIEMASASYYSRNLSLRVREGNATKIARGEYTSTTPLGYIYNKDHKIIPDPKNKNFIVKAFKLYASEEYSLKQISELLYSEGFRTRKANKKVHISVIHRILTCTLFMGVITRNGKTYQGSFKPIVSKTLFEKVQQVMTGVHPKYRKHKFLFSRYMNCEECGCRMTATVKKDKYIYYYCTNGKRNCSQHQTYLNEKQVNEAMKDIFVKITIDPEIANLSLDLYANELRKNNQDKLGVSQTITTQLDGLKSKSKRLFDLYLNQEITKVDYEERKIEIEDERLKLSEQLENVKNSDVETTLELLEKLKNTAISLEKMYRHGNNDVKAHLLKSALWNCKVRNGIIQQVTYKMPYSLFENMGKNSDISMWRALGNYVGTYFSQLGQTNPSPVLV